MGDARPHGRPAAAQTAPLAAVGILSASALAYEVLLTRIFAIVHWHHLVELAIGLALLGYGASGTFLVLARDLVRRHPAAVFVGNALLFAVAGPVCVSLAQDVAFDPDAVLWDVKALYRLAGVFLLLSLPFLAAANAIGLALWHFEQQIARIYGVDLLGAGLGALAVLGGLALWRTEMLLTGIAGAGALAAFLGARALHWRPRVSALAAVVIVLVVAWLATPRVQPAAYKDLSRALITHGATTVWRGTGIDGTTRVVGNPLVPRRSAPGLSLQSEVLPPPQLSVFVDGEAAGTLADYRTHGSTRYLAELVSALPYAVIETPGSAAVLGAGTGLRVQQAIDAGVAHVDAVEPNAQLVALACRTFADRQPDLCDARQVTWHVQSGRAFMASSTRWFDLVSLSVGADVTGLDALGVDYSTTREGFVDYLRHLKADGLISVEGPTRTPPRLSMRLLVTAREALRDRGVDRPADHVAMLRGWQRFVLVVAPRPIGTAQRDAIRAFSRRLGFDLVWLPGMAADEANRYQQLVTPVFHDLARDILIGGHDVGGHGAVSDDRPFPRLATGVTTQFAALAGAEAMDRQMLDSGVIVAGATTAMVSLFAIVFIILPPGALLLRRRDHVHGALAVRTLLYFSLIGVAFLFTEIAWIQRLQLFLGHPVYATIAVLSAFLVFAGLGSLWAQRHRGQARRVLVLAVSLIAAFALLFLVLLPLGFAQVAGSPLGLRIVIAITLLAPLAFAMGIPFPVALAALGTRAPQLVPWAWGINGCTSVIAATTAPLVGSTFGFSGLIGSAAAAYLLLPLVGLARKP